MNSTRPHVEPWHNQEENRLSTGSRARIPPTFQKFPCVYAGAQPMRVSAIACRSLQLAFRIAPWRTARNHRKARVEPLSTISLGLGIKPYWVLRLIVCTEESNVLELDTRGNVIGPIAWNGPTIFNSVAMDRILCLRRK